MTFPMPCATGSPLVPAAAAAVLAALVAGCRGQPTTRSPRPLDAPVTALRRLHEEFTSTEAIAARLDSLRERVPSFLPDGSEYHDIARTLGQIAGREAESLGRLPPHVARWLDDQTGSLVDLQESSAVLVGMVTADVPDLRQSVAELPLVLHVEHRPLGEPDDLRHRTDPDDDHPEASFTARLLRRILP